MFTGIVEARGKLLEIQHTHAGVRMCISAPFVFLEEIKIGESILVSGVCLTVVELLKESSQGTKRRGISAFWVEISPETLDKTYFLTLMPEAELNLERALKVSDRWGGHFVTGHVDGAGKIVHVEKIGGFIKFIFELPKVLKEGVISKGSIAIDGVSLTVNECVNGIEVMVIPETMRKTILGEKKVGNLVHVELDLIGKYVKQYIREYLNTT